MASNSSSRNHTSSSLSEHFLSYSKTVFVVFYTVFFLLGIPGNILLLSVLIRGLQRKSGSHISRLTDLLYINIVALDLFFFFYSLLVTFGNSILKNRHLNHLLCVTNHSLSLWISFANFYSMLAISLLRYIAVIHPMRVVSISLKQIVGVCMLICIVCLLFTIPVWIHYKMIPLEGEIFCVNKMENKEMTLYLRLLGGMIFLPPMLLMMICYSKIIFSLRMRRVISIQTAATLHINWRATVMILVNLVVLVIMWFPYWLVIFFIRYEELLNTACKYIAYHLTFFLAFANRCINPFICFCLSFQFRARLKNLFQRSKKRQNQLSTIHLGRIDILGSSS
ncbi:C-C chemokine receptor type 8-like [Pseudonaja textilis]|uniref:C-C chemokine receptor type 8-like n=1 Tax=Pseudonaja textilis TaxID=8673 RepID=UPI000EA8CBB9|nr:C-C chemokine receptor type 8-like [Pseudonaja textilis]